MDFDKPKVYGDTSITDGLVIIVYIVVANDHDHLKSNACAHLKRLEYHHLEAGAGGSEW